MTVSLMIGPSLCGKGGAVRCARRWDRRGQGAVRRHRTIGRRCSDCPARGNSPAPCPPRCACLTMGCAPGSNFQPTSRRSISIDSCARRADAIRIIDRARDRIGLFDNWRRGRRRIAPGDLRRITIARRRDRLDQIGAAVTDQHDIGAQASRLRLDHHQSAAALTGAGDGIGDHPARGVAGGDVDQRFAGLQQDRYGS